MYINRPNYRVDPVYFLNRRLKDIATLPDHRE